jgi:hypothetical protein
VQQLAAASIGGSVTTASTAAALVWNRGRGDHLVRVAKQIGDRGGSDTALFFVMTAHMGGRPL